MWQTRARPARPPTARGSCALRPPRRGRNAFRSTPKIPLPPAPWRACFRRRTDGCVQDHNHTLRPIGSPASRPSYACKCWGRARALSSAPGSRIPRRPPNSASDSSCNASTTARVSHRINVRAPARRCGAAACSPAPRPSLQQSPDRRA